MSRDLPERPSLDHLRKQAKMLLRDLQRRDPHAKLTAAQHALAREYGFASWRALRAHLQSLPPPEVQPTPADYAFTRYTPKARLALFLSRDEASQAGSASIDPEHLLLGSMRAAAGLKGRIFERMQVSVESVRVSMAPAGPAAERLPYSVEIPFSGTTKQALLTATGEADRLRHEGIGIAHLLLGLLEQKASVASSLLTGWGMSLQGLREDIVQLLNEESA